MLEFGNGARITIRFDQGMGYWDIAGYSIYPFEESIEHQLEWIRDEGYTRRIRNSIDFDTHVFFRVV